MATGIRLNFVPPLMRIAAIKATVLLWRQIKSSPFLLNHIKSSKANDFFELHKIWQKIEDEVKGKIYHLMLPELVVEELKCLIKPIGKQLWKWFHDHQGIIGSSSAFIDKFYWTTQGSIDRKKTAELLAKSGELRAVESYKLACEYCLENDIPVLWDRMPEDERAEFWRRTTTSCKFWTFLITNDVESMNLLIPGNFFSPFHFAFVLAAVTGKLVPTQHFWQKLSADEKKESLLQTAKDVCSNVVYSSSYKLFEESFGYVICFLLSKMKEEEQSELFETQTLRVLVCLAHWPLQDILVEAVRFVSRFLDEGATEDDLDNWFALYSFIIRMQTADCYKCVFKQVFTDLWLKMPVGLRQSLVIRHLYQHTIYFCEGDLLCLLLANRDVRNVKLYLAEASPEVKKKILLSCQGCFNCKTLIDADNLDVLQFFVRECVSSEDDFVQWKQELELFYCEKGEEDAAKNVMEKINAIFEPMKRRIMF